MTGIERAIEAAGGQTALAGLFKPRISQQAVAKMKKRGFASPARARQLHKLFPEMPVSAFVDPQLRKELTI
jgi:hypothetical protein